MTSVPIESSSKYTHMPMAQISFVSQPGKSDSFIHLAVGETIDNILEVYPSIERDDVLVCIAYGDHY
jgi:hypothetical protein